MADMSQRQPSCHAIVLEKNNQSRKHYIIYVTKKIIYFLHIYQYQVSTQEIISK